MHFWQFDINNEVRVRGRITSCLGVGILLGALAASGCIRSRIIVTSDPPGADVTMNGLHRGRTPIEIPFIWYWYYDFDMREEGYEPLVIRERLHAPFYCTAPLDLISEALPIPIYDTKRRHYILVAKEPVKAGTAQSGSSLPADKF